MSHSRRFLATVDNLKKNSLWYERKRKEKKARKLSEENKMEEVQEKLPTALPSTNVRKTSAVKEGGETNMLFSPRTFNQFDFGF